MTSTSMFASLLSLVLLTELEAHHLPLEGRVFNGSVAQARQFPYQAWLWTEQVPASSGSITCGGSIISANHILSAAHCFRGFRRGPTTVYMGMYDVSVGYVHMDQVPPSAVTVHPGYDSSSLLNDIAVVSLTRPIPFTEAEGLIGIIRLPDAVGTRRHSVSSPTVFDNQRVTVSGWGKTNNSADSAPPPTLLYQYVNVMPHDACQTFFRYNGNLNVTVGQICSDKTLVPTGGPCQGDSGGPMALNVTTATERTDTFLLGVTSYIFGDRLGEDDVACINSNPAVFTYVGYYLPWINRVTGLNSQRPLLVSF